MSRLEVAVTDRVATVVLNDPARRNALDLDLVADIAAAFDDLESSDQVGAVVVTGAAPAFCAGADLGHLGTAAEEGLLAIYEGFLRVLRCPLPTVAAVNGPAVGAGMNLALACDVRVASRSARFDTRFLQLGLHPGGGHTHMLKQAVGPAAAAALVLLGEVVDGSEALRLGLVWQCFDDDELMPQAKALAAKAAAAPAELVKRIKSTLRSEFDSHDEAMRHELTHQVWSIDQPAFAQRLSSVRQQISAP